MAESLATLPGSVHGGGCRLRTPAQLSDLEPEHGADGEQPADELGQGQLGPEGEPDQHGEYGREIEEQGGDGDAKPPCAEVPGEDGDGGGPDDEIAENREIAS